MTMKSSDLEKVQGRLERYKFVQEQIRAFRKVSPDARPDHHYPYLHLKLLGEGYNLSISPSDGTAAESKLYWDTIKGLQIYWLAQLDLVLKELHQLGIVLQPVEDDEGEIDDDRMRHFKRRMRE